MEDEKRERDIPNGAEKPKKTLGEKMRSGCKRVFFSLFLIFIALGVVGYFIANMNYSKAEKTGYLVDISEKGFLFKTYEGTLRAKGITSAEIPAVFQGETWHFSMLDDSIYKRLLKYQGKLVQLQYVQKIKAMPWQGETDCFVNGVKPMK
ncbi:MAG: hypothetical protein V6Z82_00080 [Flavobacteriales bacterium]